jgi:hypothetical protein
LPTTCLTHRTQGQGVPLSTPFEELKRSAHAALKNYSNVHRGSGHHSLASTRLYEHARGRVLSHLGLERGRHEVVFCSTLAAEKILAQLRPGEYRCLSSEDVGLPRGLRALAIVRKALPRLSSFPTGGGTARLVGSGWVVWAKAPGRFEAGTPSAVNVMTLTKALGLTRRHREECFRGARVAATSPTELLHHDPSRTSRGGSSSPRSRPAASSFTCACSARSPARAAQSGNSSGRGFHGALGFPMRAAKAGPAAVPA